VNLIITKGVANLFLIFALFPYVSFGTNSMDTQPHFIVMGILTIFCFMMSGRFFSRAKHLIFMLCVVLLTLLSASQGGDLLFFRAVASYTAFFVTIIATCIYIHRYGIPIKLLVIGNLIYIIASLFQLYFNQHILNFLVIPNSFIDPSRGMSSLTPEPTFYGVTLFFWSWIYLIIYNYKASNPINILILINIFSILMISKSSMVLVFLIVSVGFLTLRFIKKKLIFFIIIISILSVLSMILMVTYAYPESRLSNLINILIVLDGNVFDRIVSIILFDASINDRVSNAIFPYLGFILNYGMPGGVNSFYETSVYLSDYSNGYFWSGLGSNKILSYFGSFLYELGFISLFILLYFYDFLRDEHNEGRKYEIILLFILLNSAISVAFPLIGIMIALMYHQKININFIKQST
jgi:hypothetical protein